MNINVGLSLLTFRDICEEEPCYPGKHLIIILEREQQTLKMAFTRIVSAFSWFYIHQSSLLSSALNQAFFTTEQNFCIQTMF